MGTMGDSGAGTAGSKADDPPASATGAPPALLLDRVRHRIRLKHYSIRNEQAYCDWIKRFITFHGKGAAEVEAFLTALAVHARVAASTQNQAKSALLFLYGEVLNVELPWLDRIERAKAPTRLPVVLTREEVGRVLARLQGVHRVIGTLLYGTGLRIMEAMRLRVKDVARPQSRRMRGREPGRSLTPAFVAAAGFRDGIFAAAAPAAAATAALTRASHKSSSASAIVSGRYVPDERMPQRKRRNGGSVSSSNVISGSGNSRSSRSVVRL